jgi:predicted metalloendopeptidase
MGITGIAQTGPVSALPVAGGLGLPDREYYVTNSADMKKLRQTYQQYIAGVFRYAGIADADKAAARVLALEMQIARPCETRRIVRYEKGR